MIKSIQSITKLCKISVQKNKINQTKYWLHDNKLLHIETWDSFYVQRGEISMQSRVW